MYFEIETTVKKHKAGRLKSWEAGKLGGLKLHAQSS